MLRGFAQAQDEINAKGGINGVPLKIAIANDDDDPEIAQQIANQLTKNSQILAVTRHWTSDVSLVAASIYSQEKITFIAPISTTTELSNFSPYVFRTNINNYEGARALGNYMLNELKQTKAAIFYADQVTYSDMLHSCITMPYKP